MLATQVSTKKVISSATVLVLEPNSLGPTPSFDTDKAGTNFLEGNYTSPADTTLQGRTVKLVTTYNYYATMQVYDLFGHPLDAIFSGTEVEEMYDKTDTLSAVPYSSINSPITAGGTYLDPIGFTEPGPAGTQTDSNTDASKNWVAEVGAANQPTLPFDAVGDKTQTFHIYVGNHELSNSPYTRTFTVSYPTPRQLGVIHLHGP